MGAGRGGRDENKQGTLATYLLDAAATGYPPIQNLAVTVLYVPY